MLAKTSPLGSVKKRISSPYILSVPWWIPETFMFAVDVSRARREMFEDRMGEKHMRLNVSFNAQP